MKETLGFFSPVVARVYRGDEISQYFLLLTIGLLELGSKSDNVHGNVVFLELLAKADERVGVCGPFRERGAGKHDYPLPLIFVLPVFESELGR
jgi:hypothetical protein